MLPRFKAPGDDSEGRSLGPPPSYKFRLKFDCSQELQNCKVFHYEAILALFSSVESSQVETLTQKTKPKASTGLPLALSGGRCYGMNLC